MCLYRMCGFSLSICLQSTDMSRSIIVSTFFKILASYRATGAITLLFLVNVFSKDRNSSGMVNILLKDVPFKYLCCAVPILINLVLKRGRDYYYYTENYSFYDPKVGSESLVSLTKVTITILSLFSNSFAFFPSHFQARC